MDYTKLTLLIANNRIKVKEIAAVLGVTVQGYYYKIQHQSITLEDVIKLAKFFNVPTSYFSINDDDEIVKLENNSGEFGSEVAKLKAQIEILKEILKDKEKIITQLNREIGRIQAAREK